MERQWRKDVPDEADGERLSGKTDRMNHQKCEKETKRTGMLMKDAVENLKKRMLEFAEIGREEDGGISRTFGSPAMEQGILKMQEYFRSCGMKTLVDPVGNVHGILEGSDPQAGELLVGSHLDTVKEGGIFDGLLGIVAGAECAGRMKEEGVSHAKTLHLIATNGEEGNELGGTFGSRAMMGLLPLDDPDFLQKAKKYGYSRQNLEEAILDTDSAEGYLELHIEQGPTLVNHQEEIGIVTGIVGLRRYQVVVHGVSNHAGTTMMEDREDALVKAAKVILLGDRLARDMGHHFVETVGILQVYPGSAPVIPNRVEMVLEIRNDSGERMDRFLEQFVKEGKQIAELEISELVKKDPVQCAPEWINGLEELCKERNIKYRIMPSGATHDGNAFATKLPIGMIFVPSVNGISHSKVEWTNWEDAQRGADLLYEILIKRMAKEDTVC